MAVVAADHGIGEDARLEVVVILPGEVERGRHRLGDVAGGAEALADDVGVGLRQPGVRLVAGNPIAGLAADGIAHGKPLADAEQQAGEGVRGAEHVGVGVRQADVFLHRGAEFGKIGLPQDEAERGHLGESADVLVLDGAFPGRLAHRIAGEESAMILLHVGVAVVAGREHEIDVTGEPCVGIVAAVFLAQAHQLGGELEVQGVFPGFEELVVVDAALPPIDRLIVEDFAFLVGRGVLRAPQDGAGVGIFGREVAGDLAVFRPLLMDNKGNNVHASTQHDLSSPEKEALRVGQLILAIRAILDDLTLPNAMSTVTELGADSRYYVLVRGWLSEQLKADQSILDATRDDDIQVKISRRAAFLKDAIRAIDLE